MADRLFSKEHVAVPLFSALGKEKSSEVVFTAARALGISSDACTGEEARAIYDVLAKADGLVGVVARFAVARGELDKVLGRTSPRLDPAATAPLDVHLARRPSTFPRAPLPSIDLSPLLAPALGAAKAAEAIATAAARCGIDHAAGLSYDGALAVLDEMGKVEGIVGVVARFATARFLLNPRG